MARRFRPRRCLALAGALALVVLAYLPGLRGPFVFDDFPNIVNNPTVAVTALTAQNLHTAAVSNTSGPLGRPLAALSFALDHWRAGGFDPLAFKLTNLAIHLLNVLLVYALVRRLARLAGAGPASGAVALCTALLWGLHPLQLTSVLYVVQRMTSLAATFTLTAVLCWLRARETVAVGEGARGALRRAGLWLAACGGFFAAGLFTKENAVLLPLYLAVIEFALWRRADPADRPDAGRRAADGFFAVTLLVPLLVGLALFIYEPGRLLDGYASRPFTLGERLLTEARVLWLYVGLIALPTPARLGLYHDDLAISTALLDPWTTLLALDGWAIVLGAAFLLRRRAPAFTFGVLWFLAGHALESTVVPLEIAHEHRNYLPSLGLLFAAVGCVAAFARRAGQQRVYAGLGLAAAVVFGFCTFGQAAVWASDETIIEALHRHHPRSPSAQQMMGELMFKRLGQPAQAAAHYRRAAELAPWEAGYAIRALWARHAAGELGPTETEVQAIAKTLRERAVPPTTLIALQNLSDCARTDDTVCRDMLPALFPWLLAAQENPRLGDPGRQQVWMNYAQVCLETGRYGEGLAWVRLVQQRSGQAVYRLMEANFLMLQGHLDAAEAVLMEVARQPALTPTDREHLAVLHDAIQQRRAAQTPATDGPG
jgi:hypothetical protein